MDTAIIFGVAVVAFFAGAVCGGAYVMAMMRTTIARAERWSGVGRAQGRPGDP